VQIFLLTKTNVERQNHRVEALLWNRQLPQAFLSYLRKWRPKATRLVSVPEEPRASDVLHSDIGARTGYSNFTYITTFEYSTKYSYCFTFPGHTKRDESALIASSGSIRYTLMRLSAFSIFSGTTEGLCMPHMNTTKFLPTPTSPLEYA